MSEQGWKKLNHPKQKKGRELSKSHLLAEFHVHRFAVAANAVEHPGLDAAAAHGVGAQLTRAPLWGGTEITRG